MKFARQLTPAFAVLALVVGLRHAHAAPDAQTPRALPYRVEVVADGLNFPWSLAFLPNGDAFVTEKYGHLRILRQGVLDPKFVAGGPAKILQTDDSGLLDVVLDPDYATNRTVFIAFNEGTEQKNHLAVFRAQFDGTRLINGKIIFRGFPEKAAPRASGGRIAFLRDKTMLVTVSDGYDYQDAAQDLRSDFGKVVRIDRDGKAPPDNPFIGKAKVRPEIFTYGHRNAIGLTVDPRNGNIWLNENGPLGGDELTLLAPGKNYGWPKTTYGLDYSGEQVSKLQSAEGITDPVVVWVPSIAPSGLLVYLGNKFPQWKGDLFVGSLAGTSLRRLRIVDGRWTQQEILLSEVNARIRDVRSGPEGYIYLLTDQDQGQVLRMVPATEPVRAGPKVAPRASPPDLGD
jgi:glucose/arabinose dehydrogenase